MLVLWYSLPWLGVISFLVLSPSFRPVFSPVSFFGVWCLLRIPPWSLQPGCGGFLGSAPSGRKLSWMILHCRLYSVLFRFFGSAWQCSHQKRFGLPSRRSFSPYFSHFWHLVIVSLCTCMLFLFGTSFFRPSIEFSDLGWLILQCSILAEYVLCGAWILVCLPLSSTSPSAGSCKSTLFTVRPAPLFGLIFVCEKNRSVPFSLCGGVGS